MTGRTSGLNLLVTAIILWNTRYLDRAINALRTGVPDEILAHLSPHGWEHVNLTGDYVWSPADQRRKTMTYRPLRPAPDVAPWLHEFAICPLMLQKWAAQFDFRPRRRSSVCQLAFCPRARAFSRG